MNHSLQDGSVTPDVDSPRLVLSGQRGTYSRRKQVHLAVIFGREAWLSTGQFISLLELVRARLESQTGYWQPGVYETVENFRLRVHRLRRELDAQLWPQAGTELIETGVYAEYRLTLSANEYAVDTSFCELPTSVVSEELRDFLAQQLEGVPGDVRDASRPMPPTTVR